MAEIVFTRLLRQLGSDFPRLQFVADQRFYWSPATQQIFYAEPIGADDLGRAVFSLLHEAGHALLEHKRYRLDFELLEMEVAAWQRAKLLAADYGACIDDDHIEDCLDSYRDWLYRRSICPSCTTKGIQQDNSNVYECFNCRTRWRVSASRFCRPYRLSRVKQKI